MIFSIRNFTKSKINKSFLEKVIQKALREKGIRKKVEIGLVFVGDGRIRALNKKYRKVDRVTDVLAFPHQPLSTFNKKNKFVSPPDKISYLGEIIICYPQAKRQAQERGYSIKRELTALVVHGIFNLLKPPGGAVN